MKLQISALLLFLISCNVPAVKTPITDSIIKSHDSLKVTKVDSVLAAMHVWSYNDQTDKLTGTITHSAIVVAKDFLDLKFPKNGGNNMVALFLREKRGKTSVQLFVSKDQFNTDNEGQTINVRFDSSKMESYKCDKPDDGATTSLFIVDKKKFIENLKKSKTLVIEAEFYENGNQIMEFNVAGLIWK
jgi:hypothetical protein